MVAPLGGATQPSKKKKRRKWILILLFLLSYFIICCEGKPDQTGCHDNVLSEKQIRTNGQSWNKASACGVFNHSSSYGNVNLQYFELESVFVDGQIRGKRDWSPSRQSDQIQTPNYGGHESQNIRELQYFSKLYLLCGDGYLVGNIRSSSNRGAQSKARVSVDQKSWPASKA